MAGRPKIFTIWPFTEKFANPALDLPSQTPQQSMKNVLTRGGSMPRSRPRPQSRVGSLVGVSEETTQLHGRKDLPPSHRASCAGAQPWETLPSSLTPPPGEEENRSKEGEVESFQEAGSLPHLDFYTETGGDKGKMTGD